MRKPNFFIIGAPKCGTTSLASWLADHPNIFMSPVKEPNFFNTDMTDTRNPAPSLAEYEALFARADRSHEAVGEASTWYLLSKAAVGNILAYAPEARFIVMLRDPVEMAPSLHEQYVRSGREPVGDFAEAWAAQEDRLAGRKVPENGWTPHRLDYGNICSLGRQVERVLAQVPHDRVHMIWMDELRADPLGVYKEVCAFLGVAYDGRTDFEARNKARRHRIPAVSAIVRLLARLKRLLGINARLGIAPIVERLNAKERPRSALDERLAAELRACFRDDISQLAALTGRDLTTWR